jgi:Right handed beta helix region
VTIGNGTVRRFAKGVLVLGGSDITIRRLNSLHEGHAGILMDGGRDVMMPGTWWAVRRGDHRDPLEAGARRPKPCDGRASGGIAVFESRHVVIAGNIVRRCATDMGIGLVNGSSHSVVTPNRVSGNGPASWPPTGPAHT